MKALIGGATLTLALLLGGCKDGGDANSAAGNGPAAVSNAPLPQVEAPNGNWAEAVTKTADGYLMGNPNAPVKLVEYGSLTCPACRAFSEQGTKPLVDTYVRSGQVSWEFRHLLIHGGADMALAMLANCQQPSAFFRTIEDIYSEQSQILDRFDATEQQQIQALPPGQQVARIAEAMELNGFFAKRGMPSARYNQCLADTQEATRIAQTTSKGAQEGVQGTPSFFINGEIQDAASWRELEPLLRKAIG